MTASHEQGDPRTKRSSREPRRPLVVAARKLAGARDQCVWAVGLNSVAWRSAAIGRTWHQDPYETTLET